MTEYITKEQAWEIVKIVARHVDAHTIVQADKVLATITAADVAPVVHGEWIGTWGDGYANGFIVYEEFECSRCGCVHHADGEPTWDYCPQCGARMDGEEE